MHNIGNDIVDLNLAKVQSNWQRKGFLEKQFTDDEQKEILSSKNSFLQVWLFWSMKEAAYKCYTQKHQKRFFAPKKFSCKMISKTSGIVKIDAEIYFTTTKISENYIHTIASNELENNQFSNLFFIDENSNQTKSVHQNLLIHFPKNSCISKNELGVPSIFYQQEKLRVTISTAHHGNYGGFAILHQ